MRFWTLALLITFLFPCGDRILGQKIDQADPIAIFDEDKRWYNGFTEAWFRFFDISESDVRNSIEQWELIGRELGSAEASLPGTYASGGDTHGNYLRWSENSGFVLLVVDKCQGGPTTIVRGRVDVRPDGLTLTPTIVLGGATHVGHGHGDAATKTTELVAIKWLGNVYLVPKQDVPDFAEYSAGLGKHNSTHLYLFDHPFLLRMSHQEIPAPERNRIPVLPAAFEKYARQPVRGAIISVGKGYRVIDKESENYDEFVTPFRIRLENIEDARPSLALHPVREVGEFTETFTIKAVKGNIATVESVRSVPKRNCVVSENDDCKVPDHLQLRSGILFSSNGL